MLIKVTSLGDTNLLALLGLIGILSIVISVIGTLYQRKVRRFIAYSGVSHLGYILVGLSVYSITKGIDGMVLAYLLVYSLMLQTLWSIVEENRITYIEDLGSISRSNNYIRLVILLMIMSMIGVSIY